MRAALASPQTTILGIPLRWAGTVLCGMLLLICVSFVVLLGSARVAERDKAAVSASNLSAALTQDIDRNIQLYALSLQGVLDSISKPAVMDADPALRQMILFDRSATAPYLGKIVVTDEHGDVILDSSSVTPRSSNYGDRAYFKAQAANPHLGLFISEPLISKTDGEWIINLSRRIDRPDGSFGGVVSGTLRLEYVHRLFARLKLGPSGSLTLFRTDGTIMMREPYDPAVLGKVLRPAALFDRLAQAREGEYEATAALDHVDRLYHYQQIGDFPLVQIVAIATRDIYADWWRKAIGASAVLAVACLIIVMLAFHLRRELGRRIQAEASLVALAREDALTKLANRRGFDEALDKEMKRAARHGWSLSLLMVDADHFKAYNDTFGHPAGDAALVAIANCLGRHAKRSGDFAARYGGEEFALIFPHTGCIDALSIAEAIRTDIACIGPLLPGAARSGLSVSIGIASLVPEVGATAAHLIAMADIALYTSKSNGRNRVTVYTPPAAEPAQRVGEVVWA